MKRSALAAFVATHALACSAAPSSAGARVAAVPVNEATRSALEAGVDGAIQRALDEHRIVGAVVIVSRDGAVVYRKAHGFADREAQRPMQVDDVHRLASLTKPLVGVALLRLVDRKALDLDAPVTRWLPELRPRLADGTSPTITLRQLLTHTSGLGYRFAEPADGPLHRLGVSDGMDASGITLDENLRRLSQAPLLFSPGSGWSYSLGFDVLGRVIERVTNEDLESAMLELVTGPLGVKDTSFVATHPARLTTPYADGKPEPVRMTERFENPFGASTVDFSPGRATDANAFYSGGAGMVGSADDYIRFLEAIRTNGLLKETTRSVAFTNGIGSLETLRGPGWGFGGIGAVLLDPMAAKDPAHAGSIDWGGAWGHSWWIDPTARISAVVMTNTSFEGMTGKVPRDVKAAVYAALR